jgi:hypothetical protein
MEVLCTTGNQPNASNSHTIFPLMHLTAIAEGLPVAVEQALVSFYYNITMQNAKILVGVFMARRYSKHNYPRSGWEGEHHGWQSH